jgi:hypothetical protein
MSIESWVSMMGKLQAKAGIRVVSKERARHGEFGAACVEIDGHNHDKKEHEIESEQQSENAKISRRSATSRNRTMTSDSASYVVLAGKPSR